MRYLLNSSTKQFRASAAATSTPTDFTAAAAAAKSIKVTQQQPLQLNVPSTSFIASNSNNTSSTNSSCSNQLYQPRTKKWGQQCGVTCGCVVRFELELDDNDRVIMAEYTAKKIITTTIPIPTIPKRANSKDIHNANRHSSSATTDSKQQQELKQQQHVRPVFTNRTKRLQYVSCKCSTLHTLCLQSIQYFINRPIYQLINLHEFPAARSSHAFRETILSSILLHRVNNNNDYTVSKHSTQTEAPNKIDNNALFQSQSQQQSQSVHKDRSEERRGGKECRP